MPGKHDHGSNEDRVRHDALLLTALQHPRRVSLSNDTWEAVAVLAGLRQAVNDPIRAGDRDRGNEKTDGREK